ncbi:hypothetical protein T01_9327, partial [Trichinella spiralis]
MKYRFRNSRDFVTNECGKKLKKSEMRKYYYRFHCDGLAYSHCSFSSFWQLFSSDHNQCPL